MIKKCLLCVYFPQNSEFSSASSKLPNFRGKGEGCLNPQPTSRYATASLYVRELWLQQSSFSTHSYIKTVCCVLCICHRFDRSCTVLSTHMHGVNQHWTQTSTQTAVTFGVPLLLSTQQHHTALYFLMMQPKSGTSNIPAQYQLTHWQKCQDHYLSDTSVNILQCCKLSPGYITTVNSRKQNL
jgi:hypothetical protein